MATETDIKQARDLGMLQGGVMAAAMTAVVCEVTAREILTSFGVTSGDDLDGCAAYDIKRLIEQRVELPGLHAAWQRARREEQG